MANPWCSSHNNIINNYYYYYFYYIVIPIILVSIYSIFIHIHNKIKNLPPSPFPALPLVGHIYLLRKPFHRSLSDVARRHGPLLFLRLGSRPVLLVSSPSLAQECLSKGNDVIFANRPDLLNGRYFGYNYTSLSWSSYGDHWKNLRRISSMELLSKRRLAMLSHVRADEAFRVARKLYHVTRDGPQKVLEVKSAVFEFSFNVLTRMITGKRQAIYLFINNIYFLYQYMNNVVFYYFIPHINISSDTLLFINGREGGSIYVAIHFSQMYSSS